MNEPKIFLTEYWCGEKECRMAGPDIEAMSFKEAERKAARLDMRLKVIGFLVWEIEVFWN